MSKQALFILFAACGIAVAQDPPGRAGRLSFRSGAVSFQPAGVNDWVDATLNRPLTVGDQIFADQGGRAEIQVPGSSFRLGSRTAFEFLNLDDRNIQGKLSEGEMNLHVRNLYGGNLEVDTPAAAITITEPGDYRIETNADTNQTFATVRYGRAEVITNNGSFALDPRQEAVVNAQSAQYQVFAAPGYDDFDNWALSRDRREDRRISTRYVSDAVVGYEDLDDYGYWQSVPEYGNLWFPRGVPGGWAPYSDGEWSWVDPWGWSWVDNAPWGFAPFHYGRWVNFGNAWGWAPCRLDATPYYSPAMVAWVGNIGGGNWFNSPGFSGLFGGPSIGWFPLGPRDVYIPAYRASPGYVDRINTTNTTVINNTYVTNVYNNYLRSGSIPASAYMYRNLPGAVTAVPQNALVNGQPVRQAAIRVDPNQVRSIGAVLPAPRVAPQPASALGHPSSFFARAPRPPAAVVSRPVVAHLAPPPTPTFAARQQLLAKNPGQPLPIWQQRQIAPAPAPVRVIAQPRPVTPVVNATPAPRLGQASQPLVQPHPAAPGPAPQRPFEPPSAQRVPGQAAGHPGAAAQTQPVRPFEPPSAGRPPQPVPPQVGSHPQPPAPAPPQNVSPRAQAQARPPEPPPGRGQVHQQAPAPQTVPTPATRAYQPPPAPAQHPAPPQQVRPYEPPVQHPAPPAGPAPVPQAHVMQPPPVQHPAPPPRVVLPPVQQAPPPQVRAYQPPVQQPAPAAHPSPAPQVHPAPPPHPAATAPPPEGRAHATPPAKRPDQERR